MQGLITGEEEASELVDFAASLMEECKAGMSLSALDTAIILFRQIFDSRPTTHPLHIDAVRDLSSALSVRFMYTIRIQDLTEYTNLRLRMVHSDIPGQNTNHDVSLV